MARQTLLLTLLCFALTLQHGCREAADEHVERITALVEKRDIASLAALTEAPNEDLRCRAVKALAWMRGAELAEHHRKLLTHEACGWEIRAEAAWRLAESQAGEAVPAIVEQLADESPRIRWNMARVLGELGDKAALPAVQKCSADEDPFVAAWCKWAVCELSVGEDCEEPNMDLSEGQTGP